MHSIDTISEFVALRVHGLSLDKISAKLGVSKATLGRWHYQYLHQIQLGRALLWEHLEDELGHRLEDSLQLIAQRIRRLETELDSRKPETFTRTELMRVIRQSRLEYLKLRSIVLAPPGTADQSNRPGATGSRKTRRNETRSRTTDQKTL